MFSPGERRSLQIKFYRFLYIRRNRSENFRRSRFQYYPFIVINTQHKLTRYDATDYPKELRQYSHRRNAVVGGCCRGSTRAAKPKLIDPVNMDIAIKPGDDFMGYAGGVWLKNNPVPAKETRWGSLNMLRDFNSHLHSGSRCCFQKSITLV